MFEFGKLELAGYSALWRATKARFGAWLGRMMEGLSPPAPMIEWYVSGTRKSGQGQTSPGGTHGGPCTRRVAP